MKKPKATKTMTTSTKNRVEITREHILSLCDIPSTAYNLRVEVYVPGDSDWSGENLGIDEDRPVVVTFEVNTTVRV